MRDAKPALHSGAWSTRALPKRVWPWVAGMALVLVLGGGNWTIPLPRLLAQLVGVAMLVAALALPVAAQGEDAADRLTTVDRLVLALLALFALHMVPLPPWLWSALPGRELAALADRQVFGAPLWRPLSIDPSATLDSLLMLLPALAVYCAARRGGEERRRALLAGTLLALGAAIATGLLQLGLPDGALQFYPRGDYANPVGFFTNRNHQATFLLMALPLAVLLLDGGRRAPGGGRGGLPVLFVLALGVAIAALVTGSRSGAALLPVALVATALGWLGTEPGRDTAGPGLRRLWLAVAMLVAIALGLGLLAASGADSLSAVLRRGEVAEDQRFDFWPLVAGAGAAFWPMGSGIGTFLEGYEMHEPLSAVAPLYLNHAHNDYLEIFLEAGIPGLILALVAIAELAALGWRAWRRGEPVAARPARLAAVALLLPVLHSLVDYPLRTISITCLFALAAALLARARDDKEILQCNQPG